MSNKKVEPEFIVTKVEKGAIECKISTHAALERYVEAMLFQKSIKDIIDNANLSRKQKYNLICELVKGNNDADRT